MYLFLKEDFKDLCLKIDALTKKLEVIGQEMGESCRQSSETYHDNFPFEEGCRQQSMMSDRVTYFIGLRNMAKIVESNIMENSVSIGKIVVIKDMETKKEETYKIGSYMIFNRSHGYVSYSSPLVKIISGAKIGDIRKGEISGKKMVFKILKVV